MNSECCSTPLVRLTYLYHRDKGQVSFTRELEFAISCKLYRYLETDGR